MKINKTGNKCRVGQGRSEWMSTISCRGGWRRPF